MKIKFKQILIATVVTVGMIFYHHLSSLAETNPTSIPQESTSQQASLPEGWQNINGDRVSLSLPNNYQGGKPALVLDSLREKLAETNADLDDRLDSVKQNKDNIALVAVDIDNFAKSLDNVNITFTKANNKTDFNQYLEKCRSQLASKYQIREDSISSASSKNLIRIVAETTIAEQKIVHAIYLQENNKLFWSIVYTTTSDRLSTQLPMFDRSAASLQFS
jgi:hypothetical protein